MSEATVKATRRQLRRAMGVSGVAALAEAQSNIALLTNSLAALQRTLASAEQRLARLESISQIGGVSTGHVAEPFPL